MRVCETRRRASYRSVAAVPALLWWVSLISIRGFDSTAFTNVSVARRAMYQQTKQHCCHVPRCAAKNLTVGAKSLAHLTPLGVRLRLARFQRSSIQQTHRGLYFAAQASSAGAVLNLWMKSAARCACAVAVNTARLSFCHSAKLPASWRYSKRDPRAAPRTALGRRKETRLPARRRVLPARRRCCRSDGHSDRGSSRTHVVGC
jgi:hypothetical protein